nr:hypothetical protein [Crenothrix polyspora]
MHGSKEGQGNGAILKQPHYLAKLPHPIPWTMTHRQRLKST